MAPSLRPPPSPPGAEDAGGDLGVLLQPLADVSEPPLVGLALKAHPPPQLEVHLARAADAGDDLSGGQDREDRGDKGWGISDLCMCDNMKYYAG